MKRIKFSFLLCILTGALANCAQNYSVHPAVFETKYTRFLVKSADKEMWKNVEDAGQTSREEFVAQILNEPGVQAIEPDFEITETTNAASQTTPARQWALTTVRTLQAWEYAKGLGVVVGVLDGGMEYTHPDLAPNIWKNSREVLNGRDDDGNGYIDDVRGWDFVSNDNDPRADMLSHVHGTHVAGIVGATGESRRGVSGQAPQVKLLPLKFIDSNGIGLTSGAIKAIDYAIRAKVSVLNASWSSTSYSTALFEALARARRAGIIVVVAAGNDGSNNDSVTHYPASYNLDNIISVAASTKADAVAGFSVYGGKSVDVAAPGTLILSTSTYGRYASISGTSMAAPLVSGIAALIKSRYSTLSYKNIIQSIFLGVDRFDSYRGKVRTAGRVNAFKALVSAGQLATGAKVTPLK